MTKITLPPVTFEVPDPDPIEPYQGVDIERVFYRNPAVPITVKGSWAYPGNALSASISRFNVPCRALLGLVWTPNGGGVRLVHFKSDDPFVLVTYERQETTPVTDGTYLDIPSGYIAYQICGSAEVYALWLEVTHV